MTEDFEATIKAARDGDASAFAQLYSAVYKDMYHIACFSLRSTHDAEDVVSEAVLDAFGSIGKLKNEQAFKFWILKILSAKIKRKQKEYCKAKDASDLESVNLSEQFDFSNVELSQAMASLPDKDKLILSMSVLEGYSSSEIAQLMGMTSVGVRSRLMRIKTRLKDRLVTTAEEGNYV